MVALTLLRRAGPARLVAGMRVSSASSSFAWPMVSSVALSIGVRGFSGSARRFGSGTTDGSLPADVALSQKLEEVFKYKQNLLTREGGEKPEFLTNFLERGIWSIEDVRGSDEVTISREFGDENIHITFSPADIRSEPWFCHEDYMESEDETESDDEYSGYPVAVDAALSITKSTSPGTLNIDLTCMGGKIFIEKLSFDDDTELDTELTAEADWKQYSLYIGPQFKNIDADLKEQLKKFLQERDIDQSVALFIPEYITRKEEQEYVRWLNNIKSFVDL